MAIKRGFFRILLLHMMMKSEEDARNAWIIECITAGKYNIKELETQNLKNARMSI